MRKSIILVYLLIAGIGLYHKNIEFKYIVNTGYEQLNLKIEEIPLLLSFKNKIVEYASDVSKWVENGTKRVLASRHLLFTKIDETFKGLVNKLLKKKYFNVQKDDDSHFDEQGLYLAQIDSNGKHNFASSASGAAILTSPKNSDGASNILNNSKDKYLIIPGSEEKKSFVISLSEDSIIDKFILNSREEFSSTIELFNLYGSDTYDSENQKWEKLGSFMARNDHSGEWQSFQVKENWIRYLKFEWKTHYGSHSYCTLSEIKVGGRTMVQGLKESILITPPQQFNQINGINYSSFQVPNSSDTETMIKDIFHFDKVEGPEMPKIVTLDLGGSPTIVQYLKRICSPMKVITPSHPPMIEVDVNPGKLNEIFAKVFQSLNDKIKQLSSKISNLQSGLNSFDWRITQIENANEKLRVDLDSFKAKIEQQQKEIGSLTNIGYAIGVLLIILIICLSFGVICLPFERNPFRKVAEPFVESFDTTKPESFGTSEEEKKFMDEMPEINLIKPGMAKRRQKRSIKKKPFLHNY